MSGTTTSCTIVLFVADRLVSRVLLQMDCTGVKTLNYSVGVSEFVRALPKLAEHRSETSLGAPYWKTRIQGKHFSSGSLSISAWWRLWR